MADSESVPSEKTLFENVLADIFGSVLNLTLVGIIVVLIYKIYRNHTYIPPVVPEEKKLPRLRKDFTVEELKPYNGTTPDGRLLVSVNGKVFDVTKNKRFYGPGGPYAAFGGRDASRGLATFSVSCAKEDYDDLSDLNSVEMESVREWEQQFSEKYDYVGKLLKPGEAPTNYSDEEDETPAAEVDAEKEKSKDD